MSSAKLGCRGGFEQPSNNCLWCRRLACIVQPRRPHYHTRHCFWTVAEVLRFAACLWFLFSPAASAQVTHGPPRIRNVYIPADQLELLFNNSSKGVLMPRDKILALWEEAQRHVPSQTPPTTDAVLSQAAYEARLEDRQLRVTGRIQIVKLCEGWQAVDLAFGGLAIESAQLGGQPARFGARTTAPCFWYWRRKAGSNWIWRCRRRWQARAGTWQLRSNCPRRRQRRY